MRGHTITIEKNAKLRTYTIGIKNAYDIETHVWLSGEEFSQLVRDMLSVYSTLKSNAISRMYQYPDIEPQEDE
jgi:hypothetical protein